MKVSGFTFIKNAIIYDYPIVEAIQSILPICDELVVAVGKSDDNTLALIQAIDPYKIKIVETIWDESLRQGGVVLALETDKAFAHISPDSDWAFYIQGDEVINEKYLPIVHQNMQKYKDTEGVDGLLFHYLHFYGSYDYIGTSSQWYTHEIRVIKNNKSIYSYRDAQGFRKKDNEKLSVIPIEAYIYHYGWVKNPYAMQKKQETFHKYWHDDKWIDSNVIKAQLFDYSKGITTLKKFEDTHPKVMQERVDRINWTFDFDINYTKMTLKDKFKKWCKRYLGLDFSYKNYRIVK
jgi:hypothetical protein